jgi:hypothetical protein
LIQKVDKVSTNEPRTFTQKGIRMKNPDTTQKDPEENNKLINMIGETIVPATDKCFDIISFFKNDEGYKLISPTNDFQYYFTSISYLYGAERLGWVEKPIAEQRLKYGDLTSETTDKLIIEELGGEVKARTTLQELIFLTKLQANGEEGVLLTELGCRNIFFIQPRDYGLMCVKLSYWYRMGYGKWGEGKPNWTIDVNCGSPYTRDYINSIEKRDHVAGSRVFFRDS